MEGKSSKNQNQNIVDKATGPNDPARKVGYSSSLPAAIIDRHYRLNNQLNMDSMSAEDAGNAPASAHADEFKNAVAPACIRDIFLHRDNRDEKLNAYIRDKKRLKTDFKEKLLIYPNMVEIREINKLQFPKNNKSMGKKGAIKEFSKKSRREFIKFLCKISDKLVLWLDVTFSDDVMQDKDKRKDASNKVINRFRRIVLKKYPDIKIVYKREWVPRKSGNLQGEYIPHFHMFISVPGMSEKDDLFALASQLLIIWVECTQTEEMGKALRVALHPKSYRLITNSKQALKYGSKYISKPAENWTEESIGRSWGIIGKFNMPEPQTMEVTPSEMVLMKRRFRKIVPKRHPLQKALKQRETPTFLIIQEDTVNRIIDHTQETLEKDCFRFFEDMDHDEC